MLRDKFLDLLPEEKEAIDTYAFAQSLLKKGGDTERRFALISLSNSFEILLRAFLLKRGVRREMVDGIRKVDELIFRCEKAGLEIDTQSKFVLYEMHEKRHLTYHGKTVLLPTIRDLEAWSKTLNKLILKATGVDAFEYFKSKEYERIFISPCDLNYVNRLERKFKKISPYMQKFTWWSEIQRDVIEVGEKWDLYVHYRPRWPFFIPTLVLVKCNPYNGPITIEHLINLESKALLLKMEKKVWRVWIGIISSNDFTKDAIVRAREHEGKQVGLILVNPREYKIYSSSKGQCKKASRWLILEKEYGLRS